jgi:2-polyprenyl-3-methyl-5-hydroxy-6-metoxy-1,4-benzoquinol methylase
MPESIRHQNVISYYNEHVQHKLGDYIKVNPRIEAAWKTFLKFSIKNPSSILEIGCGIGSIVNRINRKWPKATVRGIDISNHSIEIANKLFSNSKVAFLAGELKLDTFDEQFDFVILMDVYEHICLEDRPEFHASIKKLLKNKGRIFLSVPTPDYLKWLEKNKPENIQPVDEYITIEVVSKLAADTGTDVISYELKNIWGIRDYAHIVLEKQENVDEFYTRPKPITPIQRSLRIFRKGLFTLGSIWRRQHVRSKMK